MSTDTFELLPMEIVVAHYQQTAPVDIEAMAREMGLNIHVIWDFAEDVAGAIKKDHSARAGFAIYINRNDHPRRRRFTLAHEVAHYLLHSDLIGDGITDDALYRSSLGGERETEANNMAANLIMPGQLVRQVYKTVRSMVGMAAAFDVSEAAMRIRLKELRLGP